LKSREFKREIGNGENSLSGRTAGFSDPPTVSVVDASGLRKGLKDQAKQMLKAGDASTLSDARLTIARRHGIAS
jgi:hypothetical protein